MRFSLIALSLALALSAQAAPKRVLWIGDSFSVGDFGKRVKKLFTTGSAAQEYELNLLAAGGTGPKDWLKAARPADKMRTNLVGQTASQVLFGNDTNVRIGSIAVPNIEDLMLQLQPDIVIVALGLNMDWQARPNQPERVRSLEETLAKFKAQIFPSGLRRMPVAVWLTPFQIDRNRNPNLRGDQDFLLARIQSSMGSDFSVLDGRYITSNSAPDVANSADGFHIHDFMRGGRAHPLARDATNYANAFFNRLLPLID